MDNTVSRFKQALEEVERSFRGRDYLNANRRLMSASRQYLAERYPFDVKPTDYGASISFNGHLLGAISVVAHGVIKGSTKLEDVQREEIDKVLGELNRSEAKLRMLIVRNLPIKHLIVQDLSDQLRGVEMWTADELCSRDLPIQG